MRVIAKKYLKEFWEKNSKSKQSLLSWYDEVKNLDWSNSSDLKLNFSSASIITSKRVVFNIKGNDYRLIVDIEYRLKLVFIVWIGTHKEYDLIDVKKIEFKNKG